MKGLKILLIMLVLAGGMAEAKIVPLPDLGNPGFILIDKDQFYISEGATVYIYSLKDFSLKKKFGKVGAGPEEFQVLPQAQFSNVELTVYNNNLYVFSFSKMSTFSREGKLVEEKKLKSIVWHMVPWENYFAARGQVIDKGIVVNGVYIIGKKDSPPKEIYRETDFFQPQKSVKPIARRPPHYYVYNNNLYLDEKEKGIIHVYNTDGKEIKAITHSYPKVKFTEKNKKEFVDYYMSDPIIKPQYEALEKLTEYPDYFPIICFHLAADNKIYVLTYEKSGGNQKFYVFDLKGKLIKSAMMPLRPLTPEQPYPFTIDGGKLYQLLDNEDSEQWELHIKDFK